MDFMEQAISWLQTLPPVGVLAVMFLIAYIENIFPPSPSDAALVFAGTLIGIGVIGFAPALIVATLGSVLGFMTAYVRFILRRNVQNESARHDPALGGERGGLEFHPPLPGHGLREQLARRGSISGALQQGRHCCLRRGGDRFVVEVLPEAPQGCRFRIADCGFAVIR